MQKITDTSIATDLKDAYKNFPLINFWAGIAVKKLLLFPSTYLCETAFSRHAATKQNIEISLMKNAMYG
jgi:hypothetical protein